MKIIWQLIKKQNHKESIKCNNTMKGKIWPTWLNFMKQSNIKIDSCEYLPLLKQKDALACRRICKVRGYEML